MKKINALLGLLLTAVIGLGIFVGYSFIKENKSVKVPDFLGKNKEEVFTWCGSLDPVYSCAIEYEESTSIEKDLVFFQSVNAGNKLKDKLTIKISTGIIETIVLPVVDSDTNKSEIEDWIKDNGLTNVSFIEENSETVKKGNVIRIEAPETIQKDSQIKVYISKGTAEDERSIEVKAGEYTNLTVSQFEAKARELGLKPNHNTARDDYSSTVAEGRIVWHGSGKYNADETINYGVSLGNKADMIFIDKGDYVGKTVSEFESAVKAMTLNPYHDSDKDEYSDTVTKGNIVWHGSGYYEENEKIRYGLSLGKKDGSSTEDDEIIITKGQYIGKSVSEFETAVKNLKLDPYHDPDKDEFSDTIMNGYVVWHGSGTYETNERIRYGLSLGKKDGSQDDPDVIVITKGQYVGKTVSEFENAVKALTLDPYHDPDKDEYSDTVTKGNIVWHGSGNYEPNERIRYGLSKGKQNTDGKVTVESGYEGKTESEFRQYIQGLGLVPKKTEEEYSDKYAKGTVISYITGEYNVGNSVSYKLSLGPQGSSQQVIVVTKGQYVGKTVEDFESTVRALTLDPYHDPDKDDYSDTVAKGNIVWHGSGDYVTNERIRYGLSLGPKPQEETAYIMRPNYYEAGETYQETKSKMLNYLSKFTNLTFVEATSDLRVGQISKITVDGSESYSAGYYPISTPIKVYIVSKQTNG